MDSFEPPIKLENFENELAKNYILNHSHIDDLDYPQVLIVYLLLCKGVL